MWLNSAGQLTDSAGRAYSKRDSGPKITPGKWHMIAVVVDCLDARALSVYIDGTRCTLGTASSSGSASANDQALEFDGSLSIGNQISLFGSKGKAYSSRATCLRYDITLLNSNSLK